MTACNIGILIGRYCEALNLADSSLRVCRVTAYASNPSLAR
jgi:hypothetical protein